MRLLEKVEELTLYTLSLQKQAEQQRDISDLQSQVIAELQRELRELRGDSGDGGS